MTMIKCPECRHHISSMAKACPECGAPIDPVWAEEEAQRELKKLEEVPFTVEVGGECLTPETTQCNDDDYNLSSHLSPEDENHIEDAGEVVEEPVRQEPVAVPASRSVSRWLIAVVVILALCIGGLYYYDYRADQQREQRAYELLQECSNPDFYEDFIVRFPKSRHIDEVRARYQEVRQQQSQWQKLVENGTREELKRFVQEHPTSPYIKVAQSRLDSLDWANARQQRTIESVSQYISLHPEGYYVDQADMLRSSLERQKAEAEAAAAALRDSLAQAGQAE